MLRVLAAALTFAIAIPVFAHHETDAASHARAAREVARDPAVERGPKQRAAQIFFSERKLVSQRGEELAFYSDVLRDKVVVINFIFTQCTDSCPTETARLAEVQSLLGTRVGHDVSLISLSVDPQHDTPPVLREYAERFGARDGWLFLTGSKENVDDVLRRLGQLTQTRDSHTTLFILGNVATAHWIKLDPDTAPAEIARHVRLLADENVVTP